MVRHFGLDDDPVVRQELADARTSASRSPSYTNQRAMDKIKAGPAARARRCRIAKLAAHAEHDGAPREFVADVLGPRIIADTGEWGTYAWSQFVLGIPGMRIAGGTDEVMRNIVGERVLGLPKDAGHRLDDAVPRPEGRHAGEVRSAR